ncbi:syndecan-2-like [Periophthalmus magnuspinnatus]|uniref:syndecan-2-like n=1 Tax=Periophthalmus magnuspinnatus TaxID=409849 RepID=UPI00145AFB82|nr:syndecan-2-like [Periophthalmus magnuspinnatus]
MRTLCLVILVGLATGFFTEKILVSSQLPADDLYLEGRTSGDLPIDDEDGDDGSGSGSGDYVYIREEAELLKFLNFSKPPFGRDTMPVKPIQPQPTAGSPHFGPTTAAENPEPLTTARDSAPKAPTTRDNDEEVVDLGPTLNRATQATSTMPPSYTSTFGNSVESDVETTEISDFNIPETDVQNEILIKDGRGGRIYEMDSPKEVTSENMWERTDVLAAIIACGVVGFLCAVFLLLLLAYRMKKKDEGSYDLGETKLTNTAYHKAPTKEFYA